MTLEKQIAEDYGMVLKEAQSMGCNKINELYNITLDNMKAIVNALEEVQKYREIGTVEELQKAEKEDDILKFYYCESRDKYYVGKRLDTMYYAEVMVYPDGEVCLSYQMSRHLPWGKHVVDDTSAWKEHTYPSEPREINFSEWLNGFIKKECGGTLEECRAAVEKQKAKKPIRNDKCTCPSCGTHNEVFKKRRNTVAHDIVYCWHCGQAVEIDRLEE